MRKFRLSVGLVFWLMSAVPVYALTAEELVDRIDGKSQKEASEFLLGYVNAALGHPDKLWIIAQGGVLKTAMEENPERPELAYALGHYYANTGLLQAGLDILSRIHEEYPDMLYVRRTMAYCYMELGDRPKAIDFYNQVLEEEADQYDPEIIWTIYNNLGVLYEQTGEPQKSLEAKREALRLNPNSSAVYQNMANSLLDAKEWDQAIEYANKAIELHDSPNHRRTLGTALAGKGQYREAIEQFEKAIVLDPLFNDAWISKGNAHLYLNEYSEAEEAYQQVLRIEPNNVLACNNLGGLYNLQKEYAKAEEILKRSLAIDPTNEFANHHMQVAQRYLQKAKNLGFVPQKIDPSKLSNETFGLPNPTERD